jgi:hypothetical protein
VRDADLDIVVNWSRCFETFSFTTHEAIAGGAVVITRRQAGNIGPTILREDIDRGYVLDSDTELFNLFASGGVLQLDLTRRYGTLTTGAITAAYLLENPSRV